MDTNPTEFDDQTITLYKTAVRLETPVKYLLQTESGKFIALGDYLAQLYQTHTFKEIYDTCQQLGFTFKPFDFILYMVMTVLKSLSQELHASVITFLNQSHTEIPEEFKTPQALKELVESPDVIEMLAANRPIIDRIAAHYDQDFLTLFPQFPEIDAISFITLWYSIAQGSVDLSQQVIEFLGMFPSADHPKITSNEDLMEHLTMFTEGFKADLKKDTEFLTQIVASQQELLNLEPLKSQPPQIDRIVNRYYPIWEQTEEPLTIEDGVVLFDLCRPTFTVPYIQYNDENGNPRVCMYHGAPQDNDIPNFQVITQQGTRSDRPNTFYLTTCILEHPEAVTSSLLTFDSYVRCVYSLEDGEIIIPSPSEETKGETMMLQRILEAFPGLKMIQGSEKRVKGKFFIENFNVCESSLYYMIISDPFLRRYLYIDETSSSYAEKTRLNIHFRPFIHQLVGPQYHIEDYRTSAVTATFGALEEGEEETSPSSPVSKSRSVEKEGYLKVNISQAASKQMMTIFINVFTRLMRHYLLARNQTEEYIRAFFPQMCPVVVLPLSEPIQSSTSASCCGKYQLKMTKNKRLQSHAPDIFVPGFATQSQCPKQPIIIPDDEVDEWKQKWVMTGDEKTERQVIKYPPRRNPEDLAPQFNIVCPTDKHPYPSLIGSNQSNNKQYPYIPTCQETPAVLVSSEEYYAKLDNPELIVKASDKKKKAYIMKTAKFQQPEKIALIPKNLIDLLRNGIKDHIRTDFVRFGIPNTPNSLIHCILRAKEEKTYMGLNSFDAKEQYALTERKRLSQTIHPQVYRQELYDFTEDQIAASLANPSVFLDPYLYYRGLEELYDVNIFVFNLTGPVHPVFKVGELEKGAVFEIPRCRLAHFRPSRIHRPTVIVLKHLGSDGTQKHCELITLKGTEIAEDSETLSECDDVGCGESPQTKQKLAPVFIFPPSIEEDDVSMGDILSKELHNTLRYYVWDFSGQAVETRDTPFSYINWMEVFPTIVGQEIDTYGKLRVIAIQHGPHIVRLYVPPSQPLNIGQIPPTQEIPETVARELFGTPSAANADGLYFNVLDYPHGAFCPCQVVSKDLPYYPSPSLYQSRQPIITNPTLEIRNIRRYTSLLIQLITWLWSLSDGKIQRENINTWWNRWVIRDEATQSPHPIPPQQIKDLYHLPNVESTAEGLQIVAERWPPYFQSNGIHLYTNLYERLFAYFRREQVEIEGLTYTEYPIPKYLTGLYEHVSDFTPKPKAVIFTDLSHLQVWIQHQANRSISTSSVLPIFTKIDLDWRDYIEPYLYYDTSTQKFYLVQNVRSNELSRAISVLKEWNTHHVNLGFDAPSSEIVKPEILKQTTSHIIYGISRGGMIVPIEVNLTDADQQQNPASINIEYQFLKYGDRPGDLVSPGIYAAMIPIR